EHSTRGAARDYAGTLFSREHAHMALAEFAFNCMRDRRANDRHLNEMALCIFDALAHSLRDFSSLAQPYADMAVFIAHNHERGEAEILAALGDLRNAVD